MVRPAKETHFFELQCINFCRMEWISGAILVSRGMLNPIWKPKYLVLAPWSTWKRDVGATQDVLHEKAILHKICANWSWHSISCKLRLIHFLVSVDSPSPLASKSWCHLQILYLGGFGALWCECGIGRPRRFRCRDLRKLERASTYNRIKDGASGQPCHTDRDIRQQCVSVASKVDVFNFVWYNFQLICKNVAYLS